MADITPDVNADQTDADQLEAGFATGTEGEGFEDSAGGTE